MSALDCVQAFAGRSLCPDCGAPLSAVEVKTVKHVLRYALARCLEPGSFGHCPNEECDVVYARTPCDGANDVGEIFRRCDIKEHLRPFAQGRERLLCYCFGYTRGHVEDDARSGNDAILPIISAQMRAGDCACEVMNPRGG